MNIIDLTQSNGGGSGEGVVHIEGQETITGSKTFSANTYIGSVGEPADLNIVGDLNIQGDIIQNGSSYETHAEKIYTKNDYITLRDGVVSGLLSGDYSGFQVEKYDGTNDGRLVIDNTGTARVGDVGDEQPLLTRDESASLTDDGLLIWDSANSKAVNLSTVTADASGNLTATSFNGNATSATKATQDGNGNVITTTYANQSFSNINNTAYNLLANSNALTTGEANSDTTIYNDIYSQYHSTFDLSKFTVVGTPTITDNGIASGFDAGNYITFPNLNISNASDFELITPVFKLGEITSGINQVINWSEYAETGLVIRLYQRATSPNLSNMETLIIQGTTNIYTNTTLPLYQGEYWQMKYIYKNQSWNIYYRQADSDNWTLINNTPIADTNGVTIIGARPLGWQNQYQYLINGQIDLKAFTIKVNGVKVFSGNKTGTDTVECDKYNIVPSTGSTVVINNGVASGFSQTSYLNFTDINLSDATSFDIYGSFTTSTIIATDENFLKIGASNGIQFRLYNGAIQGIISSNGTSLDICAGANIVSEGVLTANTKYDYHLQFTGTKYSFYYKTSDSDDWGTDRMADNPNIHPTSSTVSPNLIASATNYIGSIGSALYFKGSIDLTKFAIYKNGNLLYAPYLQIPYTLSTQGSKIVDNSYREYLTHLADVKGSALYYTLDETNMQFALPIGDIYGFLTQLQAQIGDVKTLLSEV